MDLGVIFSQADSGTDPDAIRDWARTAEDAGFAHLMAYDHILGATPERLGPGPVGSFRARPTRRPTPSTRSWCCSVTSRP